MSKALLAVGGAVARLPPGLERQVIRTIAEGAGPGVAGQLVKCGRTYKYARKVFKYGQVPLVTAALSVEAIMHIRSWWMGEISGKRCAKNIVDSIGSVAGGVAGGELGALAVGAITGGPIGLAAGALIGGLFGGWIGHSLSDLLSQEIFDVPKDTAVENAYNFIGVHHEAPNDLVNHAYRRLSLKYHPDRPGGNHDKFLILQMHLEVIRNARADCADEGP